MPEIVRRLSETCDVHYYGMHTDGEVPELIQKHATLHYLPLHYDRASHADKMLKTILWYLAAPFMALRFRLLGVKCIYNDETLPLMALILRICFGRNVVITVADFFLSIYGERNPLLRPLCNMVQAIDFITWRTLPLIFTKVNYTHAYLAEHGIKPDRLKTSYNPCDTNVYFPGDKKEARERMGIADSALVIVQHGILHPNKGNDRIIRALADIKDTFPDILYLLVGSGPDEDRIRQLVQDLGMQNHVKMTGWLPSEADVNWALNTADIGLVMRIGQFADNFHLTDTLSHEMACGLPIIAANLAGIRELVVDGESGLLFDPDDMLQFKEQLLRLSNDDLRKQFSEKGRSLIEERLKIDHIAKQISDDLLKILPQEDSQ